MPVGNWVTTSPTGISMEALGSYAGGYSQGCASNNHCDLCPLSR